MENLIEQLGIPKRQICETKTINRFEVLASKTWLKYLAKYSKLIPFSTYPNTIEDWTDFDGDAHWSRIYVSVLKKYTHKVIPLPRVRHDPIEGEMPLSYSQILHYVSQSNHKNLWRAAYKKHVERDQPEYPSVRRSDKSVNLVPYDVVLREAVIRTYGCAVIHAKLDRISDVKSLPTFSCENSDCPDTNLYPVVAAIESNSHFFIIHDMAIINTLQDCITYSPAVLGKSHNKPLFLIYQLCNLMKSMHKKGLLLGDINLGDIYLTENLWLQVIPKIEANILQLESETESAEVYDLLPATSSPSKKRNVFVIAPELGAPTYSLKDCCEMWCNGHLSNFDYLTILNNFAGRRIGVPGNHHIMPWVTDFAFRNGNNWRDLAKSKYRLNKGDAQLDLTFQTQNGAEIPHHVSDVLSDITFYVYMARRTPRNILCRNVRTVWVPAEYPGSIQRLQEWTPDECIPEFFIDPSVFKSIHEDLADLEVPAWASCPEDFITKHREALESTYVSERLHNWIDLTFGFKLSGQAAVKAKNVCLSMVDEHQNLCQRGVVQLFTHPHPPKMIPNVWLSKNQPRIHSQFAETSKRRLTRSSEDLSSQHSDSMEQSPTSGRRGTPTKQLSARTIPEDISISLERSMSCYQNAQKTIILPKDYNPVSQLIAVESVDVFLRKTFLSDEENSPKVEIPTRSNATYLSSEDTGSFTNRIFTETYEASLKHNKRLVNLKHKNQIVQKSTRNFKQIIAEYRLRELQILGCLIVEICLPNKMRPLNSVVGGGSFEQRLAICRSVVKADLTSLPTCVQYPVKLFLQLTPEETIITEKGLPIPSAHQILQPLLTNALFPFPPSYIGVYACIETLQRFHGAFRMLEMNTFFECDGTDCPQYEPIDRTRMIFRRRMAECKVKACVSLLESILEPIGYEQFFPIELLLPHIVELMSHEDTAILAAWYLFDSLASVLGPEETTKHLLSPLLRLYDTDHEVKWGGPGNFDPLSTRPGSNASFRSKKSVKLYHHSFLLRLIVRFGLKVFLGNFIAPLIEAVGGYKEPENIQILHSHDGRCKIKESTSRGFKLSESDPPTVFLSPDSGPEDKDDRKKDSSSSENDGVFFFEQEHDDPTKMDEDIDAEKNIMHLMDHLDFKSEGSVSELQLNHTQAEEVTEDTVVDAEDNPKSPTIPIPHSVRRSDQVQTIGCEVGSRKSIDSSEIVINESNRGRRSSRISEMSAESLIWLSHRLGPVLTARYLTRNLLKMLTLCYVGQENLLPDDSKVTRDNINSFSIACGRVVGDYNAAKILECLTAIAALFGEQLILLQYLPHVSELIILCKKRITPSLEGALISSLQLVKYLVPCLSDTTLMDQLHDVILLSIVHPIIKICSSRCLMPSGFLARNVIARKLLDTVYVLSIRIGREMTREHLCVPALQRFFLIFDKAYGVVENLSSSEMKMTHDTSPVNSDDLYEEVKRDGGIQEWTLQGSPLQFSIAKINTSIDSVSPPVDAAAEIRSQSIREKVLEEIRDVFTPSLAHVAYVPFLNFLGDNVMQQTVKNLSLILNLCHEFEQPDVPVSPGQPSRVDSLRLPVAGTSAKADDECSGFSNSFGTTVVGNRIEVKSEKTPEMGVMEVLGMVTYKMDHVNTTRHLRGNWLAYWEHEIGRSDKDNQLNLKQIKLQSYAGHTNSVRSILALDNENSFMSASKDKTVKLWSLRSEGDGSKISTCQYTYTNHRKSVHSLTFLDSLRLTVSCDSCVHLWDPFVGSLIGQLDATKYSPVSVVRTFPAPSALVLAGTADASVKIIDARDISYAIDWKLTQNATGSVRCMAVSPSGTWIAVGLSSGQLTVLDSRTGMVMATWRPHDGELLQLAAPDDHQLISSSLDHSIAVWNAHDGSLLFHLKNPAEPTHCLYYSNPGMISGTPANKICVYSSIEPDVSFFVTKLRSDTLKGVLTSLVALPLNRMLLVGSDSGNITLMC